MVGFAVASYRENGVGGLAAQGLGTSMLQIPNLMRKPILWVPAVAAATPDRNGLGWILWPNGRS